MVNSKKQRLNCLVSLIFVRNYLLYPIENRPLNYDQLGAEIVFGEKWKINTLLRVCVNFLLPLVMCVYDLYMLTKYSLGVLTHKKKKLLSNTLFVSCHHRLYRIGLFAGLVNDNSVWFRTPMDLFVLPQPYTTFTVLDFVSIIDVWRCLIQSIRCRWYFIFRKGYKHFMMTEKCFVWLLTDVALRCISPDVELLFSNQLDRLAVLIDRLPNKKKSLVEHGIEYLYTESDIQKRNNMLVYHPDVDFYVLNRTYHFHNITKVYCYSEIDIKAFQRSIVRCSPEYIVIGYDFKPSFKPEKKSVLIIGEYYNQYDNEKMVIASLQGLDIDVYLKGHPGNSDELYNNLREEFCFHFIPGKSKGLPDVDLVISYDSTLAHEYESVGCRVLYYGKFNIDNSKEIVSSILGIGM